ncbi:hypothetical protein BIW11_04480, partial [Tropilaelaps mercedesae]
MDRQVHKQAGGQT